MKLVVTALALGAHTTCAQIQRHINALRNKAGFKGRRGHDHTLNHINALLDAQVGPVRPSDPAVASVHTFDDAKLDHFTESFAAASAPWSQRFYVDATFWQVEGSPVFLYIGGEGPQSAPSEREFMWSLAKEHGALMLALEHRYYGESMPTADMSVGNLKWLTSEQALEDIGRFVSYINAFDPAGGADTSSTPALALPFSTAASQWVGFGGSYPGSLATWVKLKYPNLFAGTVGSSAPVFAVYDYIQYAEVVGTALAYPLIGGSDDCRNTVAEATEALTQLVTSTEPWGSSDAIPTVLRPCAPMNSTLDLSMYQAELFGNFQGMVQYNEMSYKPYVRDACEAVVAAKVEGASALEAFAAATALFYDPNDASQCISSSFQDDYIADVANEEFSPKGCNLTCVGDRQWTYQSCNEFGYFQTAVSPDASEGGNPFSAFGALDVAAAGREVCEQAFGVAPAGSYPGPVADASGPAANTAYGARHVEGSFITMPNGNMDPWHALGVVNASDPFYEAGSGAGAAQELSKGITVVTIDGTAHCRDMYAPETFAAIGVDDTPAVQWAHGVIAAQVAAYLDGGSAAAVAATAVK